jgi:hypothetical protein
MAATLDNQMPQQHDLSHDTLMGLEELDSHLGIFETSPSTPGAISISTPDGSISNFDQTSQTIIVDDSGAKYSKKYQSGGSSAESRARADNKNMSSGVSQYVLFPCRSLSLT